MKLPIRSGSQDILEASPSHAGGGAAVVPSQDSLIGDLLTMDLGGPPAAIPSATPAYGSSGVDLLSLGLDGLLNDPPAPAAPQPSQTSASAVPSVGLLGDIFGLASSAPATYVSPKQVSNQSFLMITFINYLSLFE